MVNVYIRWPQFVYKRGLRACNSMQTEHCILYILYVLLNNWLISIGTYFSFLCAHRTNVINIVKFPAGTCAPAFYLLILITTEWQSRLFSSALTYMYTICIYSHMAGVPLFRKEHPIIQGIAQQFYIYRHGHVVNSTSLFTPCIHMFIL
jgi:hypothetical protein